MSSKKNYLYVVVYNVLSIITPIITAPYLARVLGTEGVGTYSYYYAIAYYFTLIAKLGLTNYGTRRIAEVKNDKKKLVDEFTSIYCMQVIVAICVIFTYFSFVLCTYGVNKKVGLAFGVWIVATSINVDWFLFGVERFKDTSTRNMIIKIAEVIAVFIFVRQVTDVWKYCFIYAFGTSICYLTFFVMGKKYLCFREVEIKKILGHLKPCLVLMLPVIALNIYRSMDKVMLGYLTRDLSQNGLYENAEKIIYSLTMFVSSLGQVMMPKMSALFAIGKIEEAKKNIENSISFVCFMTNAMCFGVLSVSNSLIPWFYGEDFTGSIILINLLAITLILIGWGNVIRTQYIIPSKKDNIYIKSICIGALLNLCINALLIPGYGAIGACIGTIVAEFSVPIYQSYVLRKELNIKDMLFKNMKYTFYGIVMFLILKIIENIMGCSFKTMIAQIFIGAVIYLGLSYKTIIKLKNNTFIKSKV